MLRAPRHLGICVTARQQGRETPPHVPRGTHEPAEKSWPGPQGPLAGRNGMGVLAYGGALAQGKASVGTRLLKQGRIKALSTERGKSGRKKNLGRQTR